MRKFIVLLAMVVVSGSATYTACGAVTYTITTSASPTEGGTVSGGGSYAYGSTATLTATPNTKYVFTKWSDGNTSNPRTITVTKDATYTAEFSLSPWYTVTAYVSPQGKGRTWTNGGFRGDTVRFGAVQTLTGYKFSHWSDGNTDLERSIIITSNVTYTAYFSNIFTITVLSSGGGTVSGGGSYAYFSTVTLTATPNTGYVFTKWSDGNTSNPRTYYVLGDATLTAYFAPASTITVNSDYGGSTSGSGTYPNGSSVSLIAFATDSTRFTHWQDGNTDNPRTITVTSNATYTAYGTTRWYTITGAVSPSGAGSVTGGGSYAYGSTVELTTTANAGYMFSKWSDGNTSTSRTITVTGDATYTAEFVPNQYLCTVFVEPPEAACLFVCTNSATYRSTTPYYYYDIVSNGYYSKVVDYGQSVGLTTNGYWWGLPVGTPVAIPKYGYSFYTSTFYSEKYCEKSQTEMIPTVEGLDDDYFYRFGSIISTEWGEGSTEEGSSAIDLKTGNRSVLHGDQIHYSLEDIGKNTMFHIRFTNNVYTISGTLGGGTGEMYGMGPYDYLDVATIGVSLGAGSYFYAWDDGCKTNARNVLVVSNAAYNAILINNGYDVNVSVEPQGAGTVFGGGGYAYDTMACLIASPNPGYVFSGWSDGSTSNQVIFTVTSNSSYTAYFTYSGVIVSCVVTNGGVVTGTGNYGYGTEAVLTAMPDYGYSFDRWSTGGTDTNMTITVYSNVTYQAFFTQNVYRVVLDNCGADSGKGGTESVVTHYGEPFTDEITAPEKTGYEFGGYYSSRDGNGSRYYDPIGRPTSSTWYSTNGTLYAYWIPHVYTITFDGNGGTGTMKDMKLSYGTVTNLTPNVFTKDDLLFYRWQQTSPVVALYADCAVVSNLTTQTNGTVVMSALWMNGDRYYIRYNSPRGVCVGSDLPIDEFSYNVGKALRTGDVFSYPGHDLLGWSKSATGLIPQYLPGQTVTNLFPAINDTNALYAVWDSSNEYDVYLNADSSRGGYWNGGDAVTNVTVKYGSAYRLPRPNNNNSAMLFMGWKYRVGSSLYKLPASVPAESAGVTNIVAQWTNVTVSVIDRNNMRRAVCRNRVCLPRLRGRRPIAERHRSVYCYHRVEAITRKRRIK